MRETNHPLPGSSHVAVMQDKPLPPERRSFLKWAIHGLSAVFGLVLGVPAVLYLIDPRNRPAPETGWRAVGRLSELEIGKPTQAVIRDIRHDAWTLHPNDVVGRVWLVKRDKKTVDVYTTVCPHLGCSINFEASANRFVCPCHNGTFDINGAKVIFADGNNPAPRGMDTLDPPTKEERKKLREDLKDPDLIVRKYENFKQGKAKQEPKA